MQVRLTRERLTQVRLTQVPHHISCNEGRKQVAAWQAAPPALGGRRNEAALIDCS
jgi:hypothetical protein